MVRNAFSHADNIHARATCSSTPDLDNSPTRHQRVGLGEAVGANNNGVRGEGASAIACQPEHLEQMSSDTDMHPNSPHRLGSPLFESSDSEFPEAHGLGEGSESAGGSADEAFFGRPDNGHLEDDSFDSPGGGDGDASDDSASDGESLEDLLGQIPTDHMTGNPDIDIAATLPLFEGSTLSMLCATLLIVNCCKTHGVSNMFLNELLMLLSMSILPVGNCLPKTEYEATKILRRLGLAG